MSQRVQPFQSVGKFEREVAACFFQRVGAGDELPQAGLAELDDQGSFAFGIVRCREKNVGVEKEPHQAFCSRARMRLRSAADSLSSLSH